MSRRKKRPDFSLYLVLDRGLIQRYSLSAFVRECVAGGVSAVQLREKTLSTRDYIALARQLAGALAETAVPLIINDRVDVALASGADGVHLGQSDMSVQDARNLLGGGSLIGLSLETPLFPNDIDCQGADYAAASPVFATQTKLDTSAPWGLTGLRQLKAHVPVPLIAIGGMTVSHVSSVLAAGADGIAVVSALCTADLPRWQAAAFRRHIGRFHTQREVYAPREET